MSRADFENNKGSGDAKMGKMRIVMQMSKIRKLMKTKRRVDFEYKNRNDDKY